MRVALLKTVVEVIKLYVCRQSRVTKKMPAQMLLHKYRN